jgi:hypothetical protein
MTPIARHTLGEFEPADGLDLLTVRPLGGWPEGNVGRGRHLPDDDPPQSLARLVLTGLGIGLHRVVPSHLKPSLAVR